MLTDLDVVRLSKLPNVLANSEFWKLSRRAFFYSEKNAYFDERHLTTPHQQKVPKDLNKEHFYSNPKLILTSLQGLGTASNQIVAENKNLIIQGHLQVLFYVRPPNFQLLFSQPGNTPLNQHFVESVEPWGCNKSNRCIKPNLIFDSVKAETFLK